MKSRFHAFLGIPYARVINRFEAAQPVTSCNPDFNVTKKTMKCTQKSLIGPVVGIEDCLILNVFTPIAKSELRPVMVFIHGGGFQFGSASPLIYGPEYFLRHDIILVTINYRLDIFGFLCLKTKEAPGNVGMKDQVEALKWVERNIKAFGGDPDNVTIFGESAGAASVSYHLLSSMSRGLFHKAIMQSGSALSFWAFQFEPLQIAGELARHMGYDTKDPQDLYKIFMSKSANDLVNTRLPRENGDILLSEFIFVPCAEKKIPNIVPFLTEMPYDMLSQDKFAKIPMIIGFNSEEGYFFASFENNTTLKHINSTGLHRALPRDLEFPSEEVAEEIAKTLKELYFGHLEISRSSLLQFSKFEGDVAFSYPVAAGANMILQSNKEPMFLYKFAYSGLLNLMKMSAGFGLYPGATHADELFYMFKPILTSLSGIFESQMINKMTTLWSNFAKYGDPTPKETALLPSRWKAANKDSPEMFVIDKEFSTTPLWGSKTFECLDHIYSLYRKKM